MEQLPPMARLTARSAATANQEVEWTKGFKASIKSARPVQISMPKAPCPAAGNIWSVSKTWRIRLDNSKRFNPAAAKIMPA
jgi:hypothetical protein